MQLRGNKSKARQAGKAMATLFSILARYGWIA